MTGGVYAATALASAKDEERVRRVTVLDFDGSSSAPRGAICPGGERPRPGRRDGREKLEGSTDVGGATSGGKRPSEQRPAASGSGALARQKGVGKPTPVVEAPIPVTSPETGGYGLLGCSALVLAEGRLVRSLAVRAGEAARRVTVARGDAPGVQLGADPADRSMVNVGSAPAVPPDPRVRGRRTVRCCRRGVAEDP
jgi:hypothetical protein